MKNIFKLLILSIALSFTSVSYAATITVDTTDDTIAADGACSLREAITNSNGDIQVTAGGGECNPGSGTDDINFIIGTGLQTITITSDLPTITDQVNLDATTQPGTLSCADKDLMIEITTDQEDITAFNFADTAGGSEVTGFIIHGFENDADNGDGVVRSTAIATDAAITVTCNILGLDDTGAASPNSYGIVITNSNSTIGGATAAARNIISGNSIHGIVAFSGSTNTILGNYIGTNIAGDTAIANAQYGISFSGSAPTNTVGPGNVISGNTSGGLDLNSDENEIIGNYIGVNAVGDAAIANGFGINVRDSNNVIGGPNIADRNIISGNNFGGIFGGGSFDLATEVYGNYIGLNAAGDAAIANDSYGIRLDSPNNIIGGDAAGEGNVISGNNATGVYLTGTGNTIQGNTIGLNATGDAVIQNQGAGIDMTEDSNTVGGSTSLARNVISGNENEGIRFAFSSGHTIQGNYIGVSADGTTNFGNGAEGLYSIAGSGSLIGGDAAGEGNVISGNGGVGVDISENITLQGNIIGLNSSGNTAIPNSSGAFIGGGSTIGGTTATERNIISGNTGIGLSIGGTTTTTVQGNHIGVDFVGTSTIPNGGHGLAVSGENHTIGGAILGASNIISGNGGNGILAIGTGHTITNNYIGIDGNRNVASNQQNGISIIPSISSVFNGDEFVNVITPSEDITIGGEVNLTRNYISSNGIAGISVGSDNNNIQVKGNYIGTNFAGDFEAGYGNGTASTTSEKGGIIADSTSSVLIGGENLAAQNRIVGNTGSGVMVLQDPSATSQDVSILNNLIFNNTELGIDLASDTDDDLIADSETGVTENDAGDVDTGANDFQNFIDITSFSNVGTTYTINYTLDTNTAGDYFIQFYDNTTADSTNHGEGETLVNSFTITHTGGGEESFSSDMTLSGTADNVVATVTESLGGGNYGATSEFSSIFVEEPVGGGGGGGSSTTNNGSASSEVEPENPFTNQPGTYEQNVDECDREMMLENIEQFKDFQREITRYEAVRYVLLINCIGLDQLPEDGSFPFSDIDPQVEEEEMARVIYTAFNRNIVYGYPDGTFQPFQAINFVELLAINARAKDLADDTQGSGSQWFSAYLNLSVTIELALNNVGYGDAILGSNFYTITRAFLNS